MYRNSRQLYNGNPKEGENIQAVNVQKEKFIKIYDFFCKKSFQFFVLFVVQEKLMTFKTYLKRHVMALDT